MSDGASVEVARQIAPRTLTDMPELVELWLTAWRATYADIDFDARRDWFVARLDELERDGAQTLCLREGGAIAGFVVIHPKTGWLDQLCVHPGRFGSGAAGALLEAARAASPAGVRLDVNEDNFRAVRFYEREGFVRIGSGPLSRSGRKTLVLEWTPGGSDDSC